MELFDYLMAKKGHNTGGDLFSYLLGKNAGGSGTYTTFSGISLNISNTVFGRIKKFMLNSTELTQDGTPSSDNPVDINVIKGENNVKVENKNLFKPYTNSGSVTSNGVVYTMNNDNTITINGTATGSTWVEILANFINTTSTSITKYLNLDSTKNYILKVTVLSGTYTGTVRFYAQTNSSGGEVNSYIGNSSSITNSDGLYRAWLRVDSGVSFENCKIGIQLEEGSTATEYIEHQEQNYPISLASKNLLNIIDFTGSRNNLDIKIENQQITINGTATSGTYTWLIITKDNFYTRNGTPSASAIVDYANGTIISTGIVTKQKYFISGTSSVDFGISLYDENGSQVTTPIETTKIIAVGIYLGNGQTFNNYKIGIQLEKGTTATEYEPYYNIEYCKIGDYADQIFKNTTNSPYYDSTLLENEWYLKKNIGKIVLNGSEDWTQTQDTSVSNFYIRVANEIVAYGASGTGKSNYFKYIYANSAGNFYFSSATRLILSMENTYTLETFKTWLSSHNTNVYYPLATPQYIHISQADYPILRQQLENLYNNAKSYNGQTNITQTNENLPFNISVDVKVKTE